MGDNVGGVNGDLPLPNGTRTDIFDERDDRPAAYGLISLGDVKDRAALKVGYLYNMGNEAEPGVWHTRIGTVGATLRPHPSVEVILQYLDGEARVRAPSNDSDLSAFYALVSYRHREHLFSVRYDDFRVEDVDGGNPTSESGDGITAAYFYQWGLRHRVGFEHIWLDSRRPDGAPVELSSDGWQLRLLFPLLTEGQSCSNPGIVPIQSSRLRSSHSFPRAPMRRLYPAALPDRTARGIPQAVVFVQLPASPPGNAEIDMAEMNQINKTFVPAVLPIQTGTRVHFPNRDQIHHHVYSFSRTKSFRASALSRRGRAAGAVRQARGRQARLQYPRLDVGDHPGVADAILRDDRRRRPLPAARHAAR